MGRLGGAAHADAHAVLLDRDLADPGLLDDAHDLADPLGACLVDTARAERLVAARALADRAQERLGLLAEEREQQQLLLRGARASPPRCAAGRDRSAPVVVRPAAEQLDGALERRVDRAGVRPKRPSTRSRSSSTIVE